MGTKEQSLLCHHNAASMVNAAKLLQIPNLPCFAHTLNLVVKKALSITIDLTDIREQARKIVTFFKSSTPATEKLTAIQIQLRKKPIKLIQEVDTRWNSTFLMLERLYEQHEPVSLALASLSSTITPLTGQQFEIISQSVQTLAPFHHATVELSAEKVIAASKVTPMVRTIFHKLHDKATNQLTPAAELNHHLITYLWEHLGPVESVRTLAKATVLDARFKDVAFLDGSNVDSAVRDLTVECSHCIRQTATMPPPDPSQPSTPSAAATEPVVLHLFLFKFMLVCCLDHLFFNHPWCSALAFAFLNEFCYMKFYSFLKLFMSFTGRWRRQPLGPIGPKSDGDPEVPQCHCWCHSGGSAFHHSSLHQKNRWPSGVLDPTSDHIPTSVPSGERIFSKAGEICSTRGKRLKPKILEQIVFLNKNSE